MLEIMKFYVGNGFWAWLGLTVAGFVILSAVSETIIQLIKSITTIIRGYPNTWSSKEVSSGAIVVSLGAGSELPSLKNSERSSLSASGVWNSTNWL